MKISIPAQTLQIPQEKEAFVMGFLKAQGIEFYVEKKVKYLKEIPFSTRVKYILRELQLDQIRVVDFVAVMPRKNFRKIRMAGPKSEKEIENYLKLLGYEW